MKLSVIPTLLILLMLSTDTSGCSRKLDPFSFHGIRLGMSVDAVQATLPFIKIPPPDSYDVQESFLYVTSNRRQTKRLPNVFAIELWFLHSHLVRYHLKYYGNDNFDAVSVFVMKVARSFGLNTEGYPHPRRVFRCGGAELRIGAEFRREVQLSEIMAEPILNKRVEDSYRDKK